MHPSGRRSLWFSLGFFFLASSSAILGYYKIFTGFAEWDDEGTLMMCVRQLLTGGTLYENIHTGYGPVYYYFNWFVRTLTFTPVTHDVTRLTSVVVWTICAIACAWIVWRVGRSLAVALVTHVLAFRMLAFFVNEPGHPQELCILLIIALAASGLALPSDRLRPLAILSAGVLPAALLLVKINIGIFAIAAVTIAIVCHLPRHPLVTIARYLTATGAIALPFLLMRTHFDDPTEIAYAVAAAAGAAAIFAVAGNSEPLISFRECALAVAAFVCTAALVLGVLLLHGATPPVILSSLVLQHVQLSVKQANWYLSLGLSPLWIVWALAGLAAAIFAARNRERNIFPVAAIVGAIVGALGLLLGALGTFQLVGMMTPFCWMLMLRSQDDRPRMAYARTLLASVVTLQTLYAYPIAGSQGPFTCVLLIVAAGILLADGLRALAPRFRESGFVKALAVVVVACALLAYPAQTWRARKVYAAQVPLNLPGASRIHVDQAEAETFQWLTRELKRNCDTFAGYPGLPSFYFWTGLPMPGPAKAPPGPLNADAWTLLLTPDQQRPIVNEFARHPNACVVYHPSGLLFWDKGVIDERSLPLAAFIQDNFKTVSVMGDYQFQVRKDRVWTAPTPR
jgi:hypothetical protein